MKWLKGLSGQQEGTEQISVFFPLFVIVALTGPWIPRLRRSLTTQAFPHDVNVAVVALILTVAAALFRSTIVDVWTALILLAGLVALLRFRVDTIWLALGGALCGFSRCLIVAR